MEVAADAARRELEELRKAMQLEFERVSSLLMASQEEAARQTARAVAAEERERVLQESLREMRAAPARLLPVRHGARLRHILPGGPGGPGGPAVTTPCRSHYPESVSGAVGPRGIASVAQGMTMRGEGEHFTEPP